MRVVLDTNVFVSMLLGGRVAAIHDAWKAGKFTLVVSDAILSEYLDVLSRPKLHLAAETVSLVMARIQRQAELIEPIEPVRAVDADPADNKFLEAALAGQALYVVSGDSHLLQINEFRGIAILTVREFMDQIEAA